ncbi:hypothetical protein [Serinibacter salmoneus]|uniref:hypothetical protein n=1 Tax=Serinibacter salmoneus TaxID=556530 RepID=UPI00117A28DB|nr:hypothetical protein [Serinibacter salmoneus]
MAYLLVFGAAAYVVLGVLWVAWVDGDQTMAGLAERVRAWSGGGAKGLGSLSFLAVVATLVVGLYAAVIGALPRTSDEVLAGKRMLIVALVLGAGTVSVVVLVNIAQGWSGAESLVVLLLATVVGSLCAEAMARTVSQKVSPANAAWRWRTEIKVRIRRTFPAHSRPALVFARMGYAQSLIAGGVWLITLFLVAIAAGAALAAIVSPTGVEAAEVDGALMLVFASLLVGPLVYWLVCAGVMYARKCGVYALQWIVFDFIAAVAFAFALWQMSVGLGVCVGIGALVVAAAVGFGSWVAPRFGMRHAVRASIRSQLKRDLGKAERDLRAALGYVGDPSREVRSRRRRVLPWRTDR